MQARHLLLGAACSLFAACSQGVAEEDQRPAFDKSDHVGTVWVHVNDWKDTTYAQWPMESARALYPTLGDPVQDAAVTARLLESAGIDGIYLQTVGLKSIPVYLEGFAQAGNDRKVVLFVGRGGIMPPDDFDQMETVKERADAMADAFIEFLRKHRRWFLEHPNYHRVDGRPVIVFWALGGFPKDAEVWAKALPRIEEEAYPCVWLLTDHFWEPETIETWLPVMDGAAQYAAAFHSHRIQDAAGTIQREWPQKIFEANAGAGHQSALQGDTGGDKGYGTEILRHALENAIENLGGDSLHITNWNDIEENSHIFPSYMRRDSRLRIVRDYVMDWRGNPVRRDQPELIVSNPSNLLLGDNLRVEVASLPVAERRAGAIKVHAALADAGGEIVHRFDPVDLPADKRVAADFFVNTIAFPQLKSLHPVITYELKGQRHGPYHLRPTRLWVGIAPVDLPWSTPLNQWDRNLAVDWELHSPILPEPVRPGQTLVMEEGDEPLLHIRRSLSKTAKGIDSETRLLLNGEFEAPFFMRQAGFHVNETQREYLHTDQAPFAWLEIETETWNPRMMELADGSQFLLRQPDLIWTSQPIFITKGGPWQERVTVPVGIYEEDSDQIRRARETSNHNQALGVPIAEVREIEVPKYRIPFFHYRFDRDRGNLAFDRSGYENHAWLGTHGRNRFHESGPYGFRFSHHFANARYPLEKPGSLNPHAPAFDREEGGFLRFDGKHNYILFPPYTRMPQSGTYEMWLRHRDNGRRQTLLSTQPQWLIGQPGTPQQFVLSIDAEGHLLLETEHDGRHQKDMRTNQALPPGEWVHVALVHDLREWHLYIDGERSGEALASRPLGEYRGYRELIFGLRPTGRGFAWMHNRRNQIAAPFAGDLREIRITARPLAPEEFLPANN